MSIEENIKKHIWSFSRVGGVNRVNIETGDDIKYLDQLDQKLWTALSCPVHGLEIDSKTLELIDTDSDSRIRVPEIIAAAKWITSIIKNADDLVKEPNSLPLSAINEENPEGKKLLASAKQILVNLEKPNSEFITREDTSDFVKIFAKTKFNGDGIITEESTDDSDLKNLIKDIISSMGSVMDKSGKPGISQEIIDNFFKNCEEYSVWYAKAEAEKQKYLPYGDNTSNALNAFNSVKAKIEDYFLRCRIVEFDSKAIDALNTLQSRYEAISAKDLSANIEEISTYPLSKIELHKSLNLEIGLNPAWKNAITQFKSLIVIPEFTKVTLSESEWIKIQEKFNEYIKWNSEKAGALVEKLGLTRIREIITTNKKAELTDLIQKDKALESESNFIVLVDKLVRLYCEFFTLLKNFVSFHDFYDPTEEAIFQAGTLYFDQRSCDLCIKVSDMTRHNSLAGLSGMFLIYCDCTLKSKNEKMSIVAGLTDGDIDNIMVGRNAIFYDRKGRDWDAIITKIVDNPISIRQAFWTPYRKIANLINTQIEKFAAAKESQVQAAATSKVEDSSTKLQTTATTPSATTTPVAQKQPFDMGKFVGIFAAVGLALGTIGSALAAIFSGFFKLTWWKMPLAIIGIILLISGPSMILAWLKLRKRNLAPILDANGWAINARAIINITFGATLTNIASLPLNAKRNLNDPFQKKRHPLRWIFTILIISIIVAAILLWKLGWFNVWGII